MICLTSLFDLLVLAGELALKEFSEKIKALFVSIFGR